MFTGVVISVVKNHQREKILQLKATFLLALMFMFRIFFGMVKICVFKQVDLTSQPCGAMTKMTLFALIIFGGVHAISAVLVLHGESLLLSIMIMTKVGTKDLHHRNPTKQIRLQILDG